MRESNGTLTAHRRRRGDSLTRHVQEAGKLTTHSSNLASRCRPSPRRPLSLARSTRLELDGAQPLPCIVFDSHIKHSTLWYANWRQPVKRHDDMPPRRPHLYARRQAVRTPRHQTVPTAAGTARLPHEELAQRWILMPHEIAIGMRGDCIQLLSAHRCISTRATAI